MSKLAGPEIKALRRPAPFWVRLALAAVIALSLITGAAPPFKARKAYACLTCTCVFVNAAATQASIIADHIMTQNFIRTQFQLSRDDFWVNFMFRIQILSALRMMTEQLVTTGMLQILSVGAMFDAQQQLETQRLMQQLTAQAHKDYHSDMELCSLATPSRDLGASYYNARLATQVLSRRIQGRMLSENKTLAGEGRFKDKDSRFDLLRSTYCDKGDMFNAMQNICNSNDPGPTINRDIDYAATIDQPLTIQTDFTNGTAENDESHIFALSSNLFGHDAFNQLNPEYFRNPNAHPYYLDVREIVARRNVAEYAFNNIVAMKTSGTAKAEPIEPYINKIYEQMGLSAADAKQMLGARPSYYALMETMTKSLYERPDFFINLYTTPTNVERIGATIRAADLMQDMDKFNSQLQSEMDLSQILEMEVHDLQKPVQDRIDRIRASGTTQNITP